MVLHSAQYKRHMNAPEEHHLRAASLADHELAEAEAAAHHSLMASSGGIISRPGDLGASSSSSCYYRDGSLEPPDSPHGVVIVPSDDTPSMASDVLCAAPHDDEGGGGGGGLGGGGGGHVKFVNSAIRYRMPQQRSFWSARTRLERALGVACGILSAACVLLFLSLATRRSPAPLLPSSRGDSRDQAALLCTTPECITVAHTILSDLDPEVEPCQDFYAYACGGWERRNPLPFGDATWTTFQEMWKQNQLVLKNILESPSTAADSDASTAVNKAKTFYMSCLDPEGALERRGTRPALDIMKKYLGTWNVLVQSWSGEAADAANSNNISSRSLEEYEDYDLDLFRNRLQIAYNELNSMSFFTWSVGPDDRNSSRHIIVISRGSLTLGVSDYYFPSANDTSGVVHSLKEVILLGLKLLIQNSVPDGAADTGNSYRAKFSASIPISEELMKVSSTPTVPGDNRDFLDEGEAGNIWDRWLRVQVDDLVGLETRIANFTPRSGSGGSQGQDSSQDGSQQDQSIRRMKLAELNKLADFLNWTEYLSRAFLAADVDAYGDVQQITEDTEVLVEDHYYMANLTLLIREYLNSTRGRQTLDNYMRWQFMFSIQNGLPEIFRKAGAILEKAMYGKELNEERWRRCVGLTDTLMGSAIGAAYIRQKFSGESREAAKRMVEEVVGAFRQRLGEVPWMDADTKKAALAKADSVGDMIGYPDYLLEPGQETLDDMFSGFEAVEGDLLANLVNFSRYSREKNLRELGRPVNRTKWGSSPQTVNAYYSASTNQIVFPAGILQEPFFSVRYPKSVNYGAMGVVMGHELSHAFDDQGFNFDAKGNRREWWTNGTMSKFKAQTRCMEKQYSNYTVTVTSTGHGAWNNHGSGTSPAAGSNEHPLKVSGTQTLGENIADNGGLKAAFYAYQSWRKRFESGKEPVSPDDTLTSRPLPGLQEFTHDQLFFLSFAQVWCSVSTQQASKMQVLGDPHSPERIRVIGVLSNSKEFAAAFSCPNNSPMNPENKCEVW